MFKIPFAYTIVHSNKRLHVISYTPANENYSSIQKVIKVPNNVLDENYNDFLLENIKASAPHDVWLLESIADTEMTEAPSNVVTSGILTEGNLDHNIKDKRSPISIRPVILKRV